MEPSKDAQIGPFSRTVESFIHPDIRVQDIVSIGCHNGIITPPDIVGSEIADDVTSTVNCVETAEEAEEKKDSDLEWDNNIPWLCNLEEEEEEEETEDGFSDDLEENLPVGSKKESKDNLDDTAWSCNSRASLLGTNDRGYHHLLIPPLIHSTEEGTGKVFLTQTLDKVRRRLEDLSLNMGHPTECSTRLAESLKLKFTYLKNLIVLSFGFMLVFSAFYSLRNLQSSINHDRGLGLASLSCLNATFAIGCIFATPIVQRMRPKKAIVIMLLGNVLYIAANLYPNFFTLIPATIILGFTMSNLLIAQSTYQTSIAVSYAAASGKKHNHIITAFNGYFLFMMQLSQIVGNLVSSSIFNFRKEFKYYDLVAIDENSNNSNAHPVVRMVEFRERENYTNMVISENVNNSVCGARYCHSYLIEHSSFLIYGKSIEIVLIIFILITVFGMGLIALLLDKLDVIFYKSKLSIADQLCAIGNLHRSPRMKLLILPMVFLGMQEAFVYGEFTKAYITCPVGIYMIGYIMISFSACNSITSIICGYLQRYVHQSIIITFGTLLHLGLLLLLYFWQPVSSQLLVIYSIAGSLGVADGIWQTLISSICGIQFNSRQRVAAFSSLRMYEAIGFSIAIGYAQFICMDIKISILLLLLLMSAVSYFCLEVYNSNVRIPDPSEESSPTETPTE